MRDLGRTAGTGGVPGRAEQRPTAASGTLGRSPAPGADGLARVLAAAFLDADSWEREDLIGAGALILGARRRWLGPLVRAVHAGYPRRPDGAPRELARWILAQPVFTDAVSKAAHRGTPLAPERYLLEELDDGAGRSADDGAVGAGDSADGNAVGAIDSADGGAGESAGGNAGEGIPAFADGPARPGAPSGWGSGEHRHPDEARDLRWLARELRLTPGELDWFADTRHWNRRTTNPSLQHYRYMWRTRPGRVPRLLEIPGMRLRTVQRRVLDHILASIPLHPAAHGFVPGRSARSGAALHAGSDVVITLDLYAFFAHVTPGRIFGVLRQTGYPEATAHTLTGLCTHDVPETVLRAMPDGGSPEERFGLAQALRTAHLPQGAPSSPALANLSVRRLDSRLTGWAEHSGGRYTRYADDLAFSGPAGLARRADAFIRGVDRIVTDEGYALNPTKTRVRGAAVRQTVTGVVVNAHPNVARTEYDALKAILHNCRVHGVESQRRGHPAFREHLAGRISWASSLNPSRGRKLRDAFDRIEWD